MLLPLPAQASRIRIAMAAQVRTQYSEVAHELNDTREYLEAVEDHLTREPDDLRLWSARASFLQQIALHEAMLAEMTPVMAWN